MLQNSGFSEAIRQQNLTHKSLDGRQIYSQPDDESSDDCSDDGDEDDAGDSSGGEGVVLI